MTFTIPKVFINATSGRLWPPTLNARMHWSERYKWNRAFKEQVYWGAKTEKAPKCQKAKITVNFYTLRPMDLDNAHTAVKPLLDGLVMAQVIPDDSDKYLDLQVKSIRVKHRPEQKIEIIIIKLK